MATPIKCRIYLAGPITGCTYDQARNGWRKDFAEMMPDHVECLSPMRFKDDLKDETDIDGSPDMYHDSLFATGKGITRRDMFDVRRSDMIVANLLNEEINDKVSIGTSVEFGWANAFRVPLVMIVDPFKDGVVTNPHHHAMLFEIADYVVPNLKDAATVVEYMLTPGV